MKPPRGHFLPARRDELRENLKHDSYKAKGKLPEPTVCPGCGATYHHGRWSWEPAAARASERLCPACHRKRDKYPAGYVTLKGRYLKAHRDEITHLVRNCEGKEQSGHPLERIMAIEEADEGILVTTTGTHIARDIAERVHEAYKGKVEFHYNKEDQLLRATWSR